MKKNYKVLLSLALVLVLVAITTLTFAYWDNLTKTDPDGRIPIGEGKTIEITADIPTEKNLVPSGVLMGANDVDRLVVVYTVTIPAYDSTYELLVDASAEETLLNVVYEITEQADAINLAYTVELTFTLDEPGTQEAYNTLQEAAVGGLPYTVTFTYSKIVQ